MNTLLISDKATGKRVLRLAVFSDDALLNHLSDMHPEDPLSATHSYVTAGVAAVSPFSNRI